MGEREGCEYWQYAGLCAMNRNEGTKRAQRYWRESAENVERTSAVEITAPTLTDSRQPPSFTSRPTPSDFGFFQGERPRDWPSQHVFREQKVPSCCSPLLPTTKRIILVSCGSVRQKKRSGVERRRQARGKGAPLKTCEYAPTTNTRSVVLWRSR